MLVSTGNCMQETERQDYDAAPCFYHDHHSVFEKDDRHWFIFIL